MLGRSKRHVFVSFSKLSRLAVIIIRPCHYAAMDFLNQILIERTIWGNFRDPAIGLDSSMRLSLRTCTKLFRGFLQRCVKFPVREFCSFDPRRTCHLSLQLNLLESFNPTTLIRDCLERQHGGFGFR